MRTIILILTILAILAVLVTCSITAKPSIRLSAGPYDPESEARAAVIREMAPTATAAALNHARVIAAIQEQNERESAALGLVTRQRINAILVYSLGITAALFLGILAGVGVWLWVNLVKRARVPAAATIAPHIVVIRAPGGELRLIDSLTGAVYPLLDDRQPEQLRAGNLTRVELAGILAERGNLNGWEVIPAEPVEVKNHESN